MVIPYTLFVDVAAIFAVSVVGWVILLLISRSLAWVCSAFFSLLFLLLLVIHDLAALPAASPAVRWDMLSATGLCLLVHLVSDFALAILAKRMIRVSVAALTEPMEAAGSKDTMPFHPDPIRSFGDEGDNDGFRTSFLTDPFPGRGRVQYCNSYPVEGDRPAHYLDGFGGRLHLLLAASLFCISDPTDAYPGSGAWGERFFCCFLISLIHQMLLGAKEPAKTQQ